jgi:hypothetical protein
MNEMQNTQATGSDKIDGVSAAKAPTAAPSPSAEKPTLETIEARAAAVARGAIEVGATWADFGIGIGKNALESTAKALDQTAKFLETLQKQIRPSNHDVAAKSA